MEQNKRAELKTIVQRMIDAGEQERDIANVIKRYNERNNPVSFSPQEKPGVFSSIKSDFSKRAEKVGDAFTKTADKKTTQAEASLSLAGQTAGFVGDASFRLLGGALKAMTPDPIEDKIKSAGKAFLQTDIARAGLRAAGKGAEYWQAFKKDNPRTAEATENIVNVASLFPIGKTASGAGKVAAKTAKSTAETAGKAATKTAGFVGDVSGSVASKITGLERETVSTLMKAGGAVKNAVKDGLNRMSLTEEVGEAVNILRKEVGSTGKLYEGIKLTGENVKFDKNIVSDVLSKYGIGLSNEGKLVLSAESVPLKTGDIKDLESFVKLYGNAKELTANGFLNARKALSNLASYGTEKSDVSKVIAGQLRSSYDEIGKKTITGLKELDAEFAPIKQLLDDVKGKIFDSRGRIKDTAVSVIANLTNKNRQIVLSRLERIMPDIKAKVNIVKALEDIDRAKGIKVGDYVRSGIGIGAGIATGNPFIALAGIALSSPSVVVPTIIAFGKAKKYTEKFIKSTVDALRRGAVLTSTQVKYVDSALTDYTTKLSGKAETAVRKIKPGLTIEDVSKKADDITSQISKAKAEGRSFDEWANKNVVYHGSPTPLKKFSNKKGGVYFTKEYTDATGFAGSPDNVYEGYLKFENPLKIDAKGAKWDNLNTKYGKSTQEIISNAEKEGHDGVIFNNIIDNILDDADFGEPGTIYYAYKPENSFLNKPQLKQLWDGAGDK